jgi:hypothetical protein
MTESINMEKIYGELLALKGEVHYIKTHMVDADTILTEEENTELDESLKELEEGKASSLEDVKKDRENAWTKILFSSKKISKKTRWYNLEKDSGLNWWIEKRSISKES